MPELKMPEPTTQPAQQPAPSPAMDSGAPRDARYGGAFLRGPASSYKPGYAKPPSILESVLGGLSSIANRSKPRPEAGRPVDTKALSGVLSGKGLIPKGVPGMSAGQTDDINDAMVLQALLAAMKNSRRIR